MRPWLHSELLQSLRTLPPALAIHKFPPGRCRGQRHVQRPEEAHEHSSRFPAGPPWTYLSRLGNATGLSDEAPLLVQDRRVALGAIGRNTQVTCPVQVPHQHPAITVPGHLCR